MQFAAALFSYSEGNRRRCNPLEETVCFKIFKHTMVTRQRASVLLHDMAKMETVSQPTCALETLFRFVHFFYCNQGIWYIWMCMHYEPKTTLSEDWLLASYCSFDTLWNASAKARPLPMSQSIKMPCMRQANIWKQKNCLRMHDSTGPLALHLQFWSNCLLQFASSLLY